MHNWKLIDVSDYKINNIPNVVSTKGLEPPMWYNAKVSGYAYLWINKTHLELNKFIKNWKEKLPVYYLGFHGPYLGYIDGSYWASPESKRYHTDKDNPKIEWEFEVLGHYKTWKEAKQYESKELKKANKDKKLWKLYYNKSVSGSEIKEIDNDSIWNPHVEIEKALDDFMVKDKYEKYKKTSHIVNGFKIKFVDVITDYPNELQLAERREDSDVITSVSKQTKKDIGAYNIRPIVGGHLKDGQYYSEELKKYIVGKTILHGLTRREGVLSEKFSRMWVIEVPESITSKWESDYFDEFAGYFNKPELLPQQEMNNEWYILRLILRSEVRRIPIQSASTDIFLERSNLSDERKSLIISQALEKKNLSLKDSAYINWNKGLYATTTYKKFIEQVEQPEVGTIKMSMGAYKISTILKYIHKWNNDDKKPPLKEIFIYLGAKLEQNPDEWLVDDKNGLPFQQELLDIGPPKNEEGKVIDIIHRVLPKSRPKIGVSYKDFWTSRTGKNWLQQYNIKLKDVK